MYQRLNMPVKMRSTARTNQTTANPLRSFTSIWGPPFSPPCCGCLRAHTSRPDHGGACRLLIANRGLVWWKWRVLIVCGGRRAVSGQRSDRVAGSCGGVEPKLHRTPMRVKMWGQLHSQRLSSLLLQPRNLVQHLCVGQDTHSLQIGGQVDGEYRLPSPS